MSFLIYNVISLKKKWYAKQLIFEKKKINNNKGSFLPIC